VLKYCHLILAEVVPLYAGILDSLAPAHGAGEVDALPEIRNELPEIQNRFLRLVTSVSDPYSFDPDPIPIQGFDDQKLKKFTGEYFFF
jgi:hypothetical protein